MRIGVDIDGTINSMPTFIGKMLGREDQEPNSYDLNKRYGDDIVIDDKFWGTAFTLVSPLKNANKVLKQLHDAGHDLVYVTAREAKFAGITRLWLILNDFIPLPIVYTREKEKMKVDMFFEDAPEFIEKLRVPVLSHVWGYTPEGTTTFDDWLKVPAMVAEIEKKVVAKKNG